MRVGRHLAGGLMRKKSEPERSFPMPNRRTFLTALPGAALAAPALRRAAAQPAPTRTETLLLVQEYGPNSMDMQGLGS